MRKNIASIANYLVTSALLGTSNLTEDRRRKFLEDLLPRLGLIVLVFSTLESHCAGCGSYPQAGLRLQPLWTQAVRGLERYARFEEEQRRTGESMDGFWKNQKPGGLQCVMSWGCLWLITVYVMRKHGIDDSKMPVFGKGDWPEKSQPPKVTERFFRED